MHASAETSLSTLMFLTIPLGFAFIAALYYLVVYNSLISKRNAVEQTHSGTDIQLKKRWDLIPQLVETVKGYAKHESELLQRIVDARRLAKDSPAMSADRFNGERILSQETPTLIAIAENYPELQASKQFIWLQRNLTEVESQISAARRAYNASVLNYNNSLQTFPSSIIANKHQFKPASYFSIHHPERANVRI